MSAMKQHSLPTPAILNDASSDKPRVSVIGTRTYLIEAPGDFDVAAQRRIWAVSKVLENCPDVRELVPGVTNLLVILHETPEDEEAVYARFFSLWEESAAIDLHGKLVDIPVHYGGEHATDLKTVCDHSGLSDQEVVRLHHEGKYTVLALGSAPGFGYLHGLDGRIHTPRKAVPSLKMPKGTVIIGGMQTGVSVLTGPNGWHSIGFAETTFFDPTKSQPAILAPGDRVRFVPERIEL